MAATVKTGPQVSPAWSGRSLDVAWIESELGKLRFAVADQATGGEGVAIRASLLNMVVYAENEVSAEHAGRVIDDLSVHHPSRALVVLASESDGESRIEAQLEAHCHITSSLEQGVCCEEITLRVAGRVAAHLHSLIVPLMVPDLPVYVWWTEPIPTDAHQLHELVETADHLILDTSRSEDQLEALLALGALAETSPATTFGDLNWRRLETWREMFRREGHISEMRHHLASVRSVEVRYADGHGDAKAGKAFLMLAWIAQELGWDTSTASAVDADHLAVRHDEREIDLYLQAVDYPAIDPGWLVSIKIACESADKTALLTISRTADPYHLTIRTEHMGEAQEHQVRMEPPHSADIMRQELDAPIGNREFTRVLSAVGHLIRAARSA